MPKRLTPATIISKAFYVERAADRQLREVIDGMGRPGYILVARQMGKTNLLLNARRELESPDLLFVYIDLSNRIEQLEAYFSLVLNTAFSVHPRLLEASGLGSSTPSNLSAFEFERLLRKILHNYPGRLVFVLDEIDSLAAYPFSDRIFSQIRSMYFSRTNFPEYSRVTYVLSGVAEPNDLIKDRNVSPFNIGEKIYLNDFTSSELDLFLYKAGLDLQSETKERLMLWTRGNPRITWDVCSEIETALELKQEINPEAVDSIVSRLYLTAYDRPPVDHIRSLAETDREIRNAIGLIRKGAGSHVSDRVKNKLYLAGITNLQSSGGLGGVDLSIKNPIIEAALSEKWLNDLERQSQGLLIQARTSIEEKLFDSAIAQYEQYLLDHEIENGSRDAYRLGAAYFSTQKYVKASEWLSRYLLATSDSDEVKGSTHVLLGRTSIALGAYNDAIANLRDAISLGGRLTAAFAKALLGWTLMQIDRIENAQEVKELSEEVLRDLVVGGGEGRASIRIRALSNLAAVEEERGNKQEAIRLLEAAFLENDKGYRPFLLLRQIKLMEAGPRKEQLLDELASSVIALGSTPAEERMDGALRQIALPAMMYLRLNDRGEDFERLLAYVMESGEYETIELPKLFDTLHTLSEEHGEKRGYVFLQEIVARFAELQSAQQDVLTALRLLVLQEDFSFSPKYIEMLCKRENQGWIVPADLIAVGYVLSRQRTTRPDTKQMDKVSSIIRESITERSINYVFFNYYEMLRLEELGRTDAALTIADELLTLLSNADEPLASWSADSRAVVTKGAKRITSTYRVHTPALNRYRAFGRNSRVTVVYRDGRKLERRFKEVQKDLALGLCELVARE